MPKITQNEIGSADNIQAVSLALQIIERLAYGGEPRRITELALELGTTKTRIFRHLRTLLNLGYILQDPETERYHVGTRLVHLGSAVAKHFDLAALAVPYMRELREAVQFSVSLGKVTDEGIEVVEALPSISSWLEIGTSIGARLDLHCSAQGKLVLAYGSSDHWKMMEDKGLRRFTDKTKTNVKTLKAEVEAVRKNGWAEAPEELLTGMNALAAPIFDANGALIATLAVLGSIDSLASPPTIKQIAAVKHAAEKITSQFSGKPPR